jgi:hypothetical protein
MAVDGVNNRWYAVIGTTEKTIAIVIIRIANYLAKSKKSSALELDLPLDGMNLGTTHFKIIQRTQTTGLLRFYQGLSVPYKCGKIWRYRGQ